jgi:hypothetical protein
VCEKVGRGCSAVKYKMFFITVETKTLKFRTLKTFFFVKHSEMAFSSILILMNFCLFELEAAIHCGVNGRIIAKIRSFIS